MREPEREDDRLALDLGLVADARDLELAGEPFVTPSTELATRLRSSPWQARMLRLVVRARDLHLVVRRRPRSARREWR